MIRRDVFTHAVFAFVISAATLVISGAVGWLLADVAVEGFQPIADPLSVMATGSIVTAITAYPAPFAFAAISTAYEFRGADQ